MTRGPLRWMALLALGGCTFVHVTSENLPIGLLLPMAEALRTTPSAIGLLVTAYGVVVVLASIPLTHLTRRIPRRTLLVGLLAAFTLSTAATGLAPAYPALLSARVASALIQALFWSIVTPTAAGLLPAHRRGHAMGILLGGATLANVLGVPAGTWVGQHAGWRAAFAALAAAALLTTFAVLALLPRGAAAEEAVVRVGTAPDARRYWIMVAMTALTVTGAFTSFTYVTPFLREVSDLPADTMDAALLLRGLAGLAGVVAGGALAERRPALAQWGPVGLQAFALLGLYAAGAHGVTAVALVAVTGFALSALATALGSRLLLLAPGRADVASAVTSTAFNVGITLGALTGSALLTTTGVRSTALAGALLSVAAAALVALERRPGGGGQPSFGHQAPRPLGAGLARPPGRLLGRVVRTSRHRSPERLTRR